MLRQWFRTRPPFYWLGLTVAVVLVLGFVGFIASIARLAALT